MTFNDKPELFEDLRNTRVGFVPEGLATYLWPEEGEDNMTLACFLLKVLQNLKILVPLDSELSKSICGDISSSRGQICYFMPTLRPDFDKTEPKVDSNSLIITYSIAMLPFHLLADMLLHLQRFFGDTITFDPKQFYNTICFMWHNIQERCKANIVVRFTGDVVEISVNFISQAPRMSTVIHLFSLLKTACIQFFYQVSTQISDFRYELAIVCPCLNGKPSHADQVTAPNSKAHFITFHPLLTGRKSFFCPSCQKSVSSDKLPWARFLWTQVAYQGPSRHSIHPNGTHLSPIN